MLLSGGWDPPTGGPERATSKGDGPRKVESPPHRPERPAQLHLPLSPSRLARAATRLPTPPSSLRGVGSCSWLSPPPAVTPFLPSSARRGIYLYTSLSWPCGRAVGQCTSRCLPARARPSSAPPSSRQDTFEQERLVPLSSLLGRQWRSTR